MIWWDIISVQLITTICTCTAIVSQFSSVPLLSLIYSFYLIKLTVILSIKKVIQTFPHYSLSKPIWYQSLQCSFLKPWQPCLSMSLTPQSPLLPIKRIQSLKYKILTHSIQIATIRLNGENFLCWSQSMMTYIRGRGKISYFTREKKEPSTDDSSSLRLGC